MHQISGTTPITTVIVPYIFAQRSANIRAMLRTNGAP